MQVKKILLLLLFLPAIHVFAQSNFTYSPDKPKAGDIITVSYTPAGSLANIASPISATVSILAGNSMNANDLQLSKAGEGYTAIVKTDTSDNFVFFSFSSGKVFDNNYNNGYYIQLYDGDKLKKGANISVAQYYQFLSRGPGVDAVANNTKALASMEEEFKLYPESRKDNLISYLRLYSQVKKDDATSMIQKEIESALKTGLKDEEDYTRLQNLYGIAKLTQQASFISTLMKEKFPNGKWKIGETTQKFMTEKDILKKEQMLDMIAKNIKTNPDWKYLEQSLPFYQSSMPAAYAEKKDWAGLKSAVLKYNVKGSSLASLYNNTAWEMQVASDNLPLAEELSATATMLAKNEWEHPSGKKPQFLTKSQWDDARANDYASYADTYGMVLYRSGKYKKGLPFAEDAAIKIGKGLQADENNTYALLAEKALPEKKYLKQLEQFEKDGKATSEITNILKRAYVKKHNSESGFEDYIAGLDKENYEKMLEQLKKGMLKNATPSFALMDLNGKRIDIADLKNKIVVVDFWATWCGPCKASFPGMQKMIAKYKNDPDVEFIFVDTWEHEEAKEKNALAFIASKKYDFHVLMDNDNKVIEQFKVDGIPTKFVIDKEGMIRFKAVGFDGSDDKLVDELSAMIDMVKKM